jgi:hypothetical protein
MTYIPLDPTDSLLGEDVTDRKAYELIIPVLVEVGMTAVCEPLIKFITETLVRPRDTCSAPLAIQNQAGLADYVPSPAVISFHHNSILYRDLPGLQPASSQSGSDPTMLDIARSVCDFLSKASLDHMDRVEVSNDAQRPKAVRTRMSDVIVDRILLLCQVSDGDDFLPIYHEWSARPQDVSERWILQQAVDATCASLSEPYFEVTLTQVLAFKKFRFSGLVYFNIGTGSYHSSSLLRTAPPPRHGPCWWPTGS